jgi:hypothetical protein
MPSFSAFEVLRTAKGACVFDGEFYTTDSSNGHTVPVIPSTYSAFKGVPVRSGTGVWSVTMRDPAFKVLLAEVKSFTTTGNAVSVIMQANTTDSVGRLVINWTFCTFGTTTPADITTSAVFNVFVAYSETSVS